MENITAPTASGLPRREFIRKTAAAAAAAAATPFFRTPVYGQNQAPSAGVAGANNKLTVAVVGVGFGIGKNHLEGIHKDASANSAVVAAACDVFNKRPNWAKDTAELKDSHPYTHHRPLLDRND